MFHTYRNVPLRHVLHLCFDYNDIILSMWKINLWIVAQSNTESFNLKRCWGLILRIRHTISSVCVQNKIKSIFECILIRCFTVFWSFFSAVGCGYATGFASAARRLPESQELSADWAVQSHCRNLLDFLNPDMPVTPTNLIPYVDTIFIYWNLNDVGNVEPKSKITGL